MKQELKELSREKLVEIFLKMEDILSEEQYLELENMVEEAAADSLGEEKYPVKVRMFQELVNEKMEQIDEGDLYLDTDEYEDYSSSENQLIWKCLRRTGQKICFYILEYMHFSSFIIEEMFYTGELKKSAASI